MYIFFPKTTADLPRGRPITTKNLQHIRVYVDKEELSCKKIGMIGLASAKPKMKNSRYCRPKSAHRGHKKLCKVIAMKPIAERTKFGSCIILEARARQNQESKGDSSMSLSLLDIFKSLDYWVLTIPALLVSSPGKIEEKSSRPAERRLPRDWARWFG